MDNIFFDTNLLKKCGKNVIIGKTVRIRYPELVEIDDNVIIDDFCYISTTLKISSYVHISSGCKIIGGKESMVSFSKYSTLSPNVVLVLVLMIIIVELQHLWCLRSLREMWKEEILRFMNIV